MTKIHEAGRAAGVLPSVLGSSTTYEVQDMKLRLSPGIF